MGMRYIGNEIKSTMAYIRRKLASSSGPHDVEVEDIIFMILKVFKEKHHVIVDIDKTFKGKASARFRDNISSYPH